MTGSELRAVRGQDFNTLSAAGGEGGGGSLLDWGRVMCNISLHN